MKEAIEEARKTMNLGYGGPFGAMIKKDGKVLAIASNTVLKDDDATAHAEINAIRKAGKVLGTYNLKGCELYATGYPCPMCLAAIMWAGIDKVYYGTTLEEAEKIGFRDDYIYETLKDKKILNMEQIDHDKCLELFNEYKNVIY